MVTKLKLLALLLASVSISAFFREDAKSVDPSQYQDDIADLVGTYLPLYHYQRYKLNDMVSERLLEQYIETLDLNRMYFLASDIDTFMAWKNKLDDDLRAEPVNLEKAFHIYNVYKKRVGERVDVILAHLKKEPDFTLKESFSYDRTEAPWAKTTADLDELWRLRIKEEILQFRLRDKPKDEYLDILEKRYNRLRKTIEENEPADVTEMFLSSLAGSFDPHSAYLKPASKDNFDIQMGHSLEGIGATLTTEGEYTKVVSIVKGGPAARSGKIHPDDKIIAVAQGDKPFEDVIDLRLDKVVKQIRGPKGSTVRLTIIPGDATDHSITKVVTLIRDRVELTSQDAKAEIKELDTAEGKTLRVGVINVPSFYLDTKGKYQGNPNYKSTTRDVRKLLKELEEQNVDGVVMDLRTNGGGSLDEAIQLTGLFIDSGPVVQIKDFMGKVDVEHDPDPRMVYDGPLLVLTSVFSASASEIFSSAIQDYGRGIVVGAKSTHGKGTVQNVVPLQNLLTRKLDKHFADDIAGALKLTTHKFYRVSGGSTQHKGVEPDVVLPSPYDGMKVKEEELDYALKWDEIASVKHKNYNQVAQYLDMLKANSLKRVDKDPEFRYVREDLERLQKQREENRVTLNLDERTKEREETKSLGESRDEERKLRTAIARTIQLPGHEEEEPEEDTTEETDAEEEKRVAVPDFVLDEALLIIRDYISLRTDRVAGVLPPKKDTF